MARVHLVVMVGGRGGGNGELGNEETGGTITKWNATIIFTVGIITSTLLFVIWVVRQENQEIQIQIKEII